MTIDGELRALARLPHPYLYVCDIELPSSQAVSALSGMAYDRARAGGPGDINTSGCWPDALDDLESAAKSLPQRIGDALSCLPIEGIAREARRSVSGGSVNWLSCQGAAHHNDAFGAWTRELFWVLALECDGVELVMRDLEVRLPLRPGQLIVFDPCLPHAVCRPEDGGRFKRDSFRDPASGSQAFLSGEIWMSAAAWRRVGSPLVARTHRSLLGRIDLLAASIVDATGGIEPASVRRF